MAEVTETDFQATPARRPRSMEDEEMATPDINKVAMKIQRAKEAYRAYVESDQEKPTKGEVFGWYFYGMCSYFVHTVLVPILFPLIIGQTVPKPKEPQRGWFRSYRDLQCQQREVQLYETLIQKAIKINSIELSPLEWTSISWVLGLLLATPILVKMSMHLDHGRNQQLIAGTITAIGALFCLPAGFFNTRWIFPPYIAAIIIASTVGAAFHCRHLGHMILGYFNIRTSEFSKRKAKGSILSLYSTAAGCLGSATISAFIYYMLRKSDSFTSLWVVSIFSGLIWLTGTSQIFSTSRNGTNTTTTTPKITHAISIFKYSHAAGSLVGVLLSSFTTMCIFTAGVLYAVGDLCIKEMDILYLWLIHFMFPLLSLPLSKKLQQLIRADAVKMQLLGFLLTLLTSGFGFYFRNHNWHIGHLLFFAAIHSTAMGLLYAYGRVLLLDCCPVGKEGVFSVWFSWIKAVGTCIGFAFASSLPRNVDQSFGVAFCSGAVGTLVLIFGNVDNFRGAKAAGNVIDDDDQHSKKGSSPVHGLIRDSCGIEVKGSSIDEVPSEGKMEL